MLYNQGQVLFKDTRLKFLLGTYNWLQISLNLILMPHILPTSAYETISEETEDYYPVFYNDFAWAAQ